MSLRTEADEARDFREWLRVRGIAFDEAPRHGPQNRRRGNGITKGRADFILSLGGRQVAVELKREDGGTVDEHQVRWLREFRKRGGITAICFGADEAIATAEGLAGL